MKDAGHIQTDSIIEEIERKLRKEYSQAQAEVTRKYNLYMQSFKAKDAQKRLMLQAGQITQREYADWRYGQVCIGKRWKALKEQLAEDLTTVDMKARSITQDYMPEVYALNMNYATYQVEHDGMIDTSFTLYNSRAVENMIRDDARLLPYPRKDSPTDRMLRANKDLAWNKEKIHSAITQGILQGESIPKIGKRLEHVVDMDKTAAVRNARTMMTGVQNKARTDAYRNITDKGVQLVEEWVATLDGRTRHSHRHMHGERKTPDEEKFSNGLRYPADPDGAPEEVYNCRCRLVAIVKGYEIETVKYSPKLGDMTYEEWLEDGR